MKNIEITKPSRLLNKDGSLANPGWSRSIVQKYYRSQIKASKFRIKEWDYYLVLNEDFACAFTVSDNGYMGLESVSLLDFKNDWQHTQSVVVPFPMGKFNMPYTSRAGNVEFHNDTLDIGFIKLEDKRIIKCRFKNFYKGKTFECEIILREPKMDSIVVATPWKEDKKAFYYNQKINCMPASGKAVFDGREFVFDPKTDFGTLDWGRGVWTYDNTWRWGSGNGYVNGKPFGFNIGYGFGNGIATENALFYDGVIHKLDKVYFHYDDDDYMKPWKFTSDNDRFQMDFVPVMDRYANLDYKIIVSKQHQVFGKMSGTAVLDDGTKVELENLMCFAEVVHNRY